MAGRIQSLRPPCRFQPQSKVAVAGSCVAALCCTHRVVRLLAPPYQNKSKNKGMWCRRKRRHWIVKLITALSVPSFSVISSSGSIHSPFDEFYWVWESQRGQMLCFIMAIHNLILRQITDFCLTFLPFNSCKFFSKQWRKGKKIKPPC